MGKIKFWSKECLDLKMFVEKKCWSKNVTGKMFWFKKFRSKIFVGQTKDRVQKNLRINKFLAHKSSGLKNWVKECVQTEIPTKKYHGPIQIWVKKNCGRKKCWSQKFFGIKTLVRKVLVKKSFQWKKKCFASKSNFVRLYKK